MFLTFSCSIQHRVALKSFLFYPTTDAQQGEFLAEEGKIKRQATLLLCV